MKLCNRVWTIPISAVPSVARRNPVFVCAGSRSVDSGDAPASVLALLLSPEHDRGHDMTVPATKPAATAEPVAIHGCSLAQVRTSASCARVRFISCTVCPIAVLASTAWSARKRCSFRFLALRVWAIRGRTVGDIVSISNLLSSLLVFILCDRPFPSGFLEPDHDAVYSTPQPSHEQ